MIRFTLLTHSKRGVTYGNIPPMTSLKATSKGVRVWSRATAAATNFAKIHPFTGECPVRCLPKVIICPYPFCNENEKCGLGRPVDEVRAQCVDDR